MTDDSPAELKSDFGSMAASRWVAQVLAGQEAAPLTGSMAELIIATVEAEGVAGLLHRQLLSASPQPAVPRRITDVLAALHARAIALEMLRTTESRRVLCALEGAGIELLVLKGAALAQWVYPQSYLRARDDLDLLFADRHSAERARQILLALGYVGDEPLANGPQYELTMTHTQSMGPDWHVDVHWRLSQHPVFADRFGFTELMLDALPLPLGGHGLGKVHALLHAAIHRISNMLIGQGDRLIWLFDLHLMAPILDPQDWSRLLSLAQSKQLAGPLLAAMKASQRLLATPWPSASLAALEMLAASESFDVEQAHLRGYFEWQTLRTMPLNARVRLALRKLFPEPRYMVARYRLQHGWQLPRAYLQRWLTGLRILGGWFRQRPPL